MNSESKSGNSLCDARFPVCDALPTSCAGDFRPATPFRRFTTLFRRPATPFFRPRRPAAGLRRSAIGLRRPSGDLRDGLPSGCDAPFSTCDGPPAAGDAFLPGCDGLPTTCDGLKPVCAATYESRETGHFPARPVLEVSGGSLTFRQSTKAGSNLMPKTGLGGPSPMPLKATMR
jgi:hypothetical protein